VLPLGKLAVAAKVMDKICGAIYRFPLLLAVDRFIYISKS